MIDKLMSDSKTGFAGVNLACGGKLCQEAGWINADHCPSTKTVLNVNLLRTLPFAENTFDVVYHSQFIEHLPEDKALLFMNECFRVLKPDGVLRIVTPDLENQAAEYLRTLQAVLKSPNDELTRLRYDWIRLEMLDQLTRHSSGGDMVDFLARSGSKLREYLVQRMGRSGINLIPDSEIAKKSISIRHILGTVKREIMAALQKITPEPLRVGRFRLSGESHLCMYDEYLLSNLFVKSGFENVVKLSAMESRIRGWSRTLLDCDRQGNPDGQV